jgi:hypothetical protein
MLRGGGGTIVTRPATASVGYVLEVYPRLSETFVVTEILAREAQGERVSIFALRPPTDALAPAAAGRVRAALLADLTRGVDEPRTPARS